MSTPTCTGRMSSALSWNWTDDNGSRNPGNLSRSLSHLDGNVSNVVYKEYTIAKSGTQAIDLAGSLTDFGGNTITWTKLVGLMVSHTLGSAASSISFGPYNAANPIAGLMGNTNDVETLVPGAWLARGWERTACVTIAAGTADALLITNNDASNAASVKVAFLGDD